MYLIHTDAIHFNCAPCLMSIAMTNDVTLCCLFVYQMHFLIEWQRLYNKLSCGRICSVSFQLVHDCLLYDDKNSDSWIIFFLFKFLVETILVDISSTLPKIFKWIYSTMQLNHRNRRRYFRIQTARSLDHFYVSTREHDPVSWNHVEIILF